MPRQITTAIIVDADGTMRHVPATVYQENGKWYATIVLRLLQKAGLVDVRTAAQQAAGDVRRDKLSGKLLKHVKTYQGF